MGLAGLARRAGFLKMVPADEPEDEDAVREAKKAAEAHQKKEERDESCFDIVDEFPTYPCCTAGGSRWV